MAKRGSNEWKKNISLSRIGKCSGKHNSFFGKKHTVESKLKNSIAHLGNTAWNKGKKLHYRVWNKGKKGVMPLAWNKGKKLGRNKYISNENHYLWKGDKVGYKALHGWLRRKYGIPDKCEKCGNNKFMEWANISGEYKRERNDWMKLCKSCHNKFDGTIKNIRKQAQPMA